MGVPVVEAPVVEGRLLLFFLPPVAIFSSFLAMALFSSMILSLFSLSLNPLDIPSSKNFIPSLLPLFSPESFSLMDFSFKWWILKARATLDRWQRAEALGEEALCR